jgi:hypothetical protein
LVKKAHNRALAVATTQNMLMWKLGLASPSHIETDDYERYLQLFDQGLSEDQARCIDDLFLASTTVTEITSEVIDGTAI